MLLSGIEPNSPDYETGVSPLTLEQRIKSVLTVRLELTGWRLTRALQWPLCDVSKIHSVDRPRVELGSVGLRVRASPAKFAIHITISPAHGIRTRTSAGLCVLPGYTNAGLIVHICGTPG